jgi:hypothetical protein
MPISTANCHRVFADQQTRAYMVPVDEVKDVIDEEDEEEAQV